jgi:hypothetical protein
MGRQRRFTTPHVQEESPEKYCHCRKQWSGGFAAAPEYPNNLSILDEEEK